MLVAPFSDPVLRSALRRAARPDEDVILDLPDAEEALHRGFPRLVLFASEDEASLSRLGRWLGPGLPVLRVSDQTRQAWEDARKSAEIPSPRVEWTARRLEELIRGAAVRHTWVDGALRDLTRAAGAPLPWAFRGVARRVMEHPARYEDLYGLSGLAGLTRGALKARFRRRGLPSPYTYLRWLRSLAAAHVLSDRSVTILHASNRLGFTTNGNFCRTIRSTTGLAPSELRDARGWNRLVTTFAAAYLDRSSLESWHTLEDLFIRRAA